ncbi:MULTISPECIES: TetR/AcrR family transcriptional regulator [Roseiflexus]|uniref:Transcriptional regulator, TetR family n=1 Tax=Roseiflexus castenholzii (strain DSM 13941 / HLO8) TaxID=383372 RepID=A7NK39_ROSCS|nr:MULTISPECIES: TetR/AcrR family transcriptional regulator [Roseiflexus]ABU57859.1 transcriptional regulator, TetR family [Roseiflexus castenholzii DSM 13941]GIW00755.1 MAG: TetR family transcriptional regulator [Roseiflexus sp.]
MAGADDSNTRDRRRQIMDAALQVFSTKGFQKATNRDIAEAAGGISPGLIYHYFKDKQDLFLSMLRERATILALVDHPQQLMDLPPRQGLTLVGRSYLTMMSIPENVAVFRIILAEALHFPEVAAMIRQHFVDRVFGVLRAYLQRQIDNGRLRPHDTSISVRTFLGSIVVHVIAREVLRQPEALQLADDQAVAMAVDVFLHGLSLEGEDA